MFHLTTLVIANSLLRHFPKCISLVGPFLNFTFEFTQFHLWVIYSVPSSPNLFSFQLDEALSVRWCFMFLKITPLLAPYAADGPNTLHCNMLAPMSIDILEILKSKKITLLSSYLKITPLLAPYAAGGPSTLHWFSWLNNSFCCLIPAQAKKTPICHLMS